MPHILFRVQTTEAHIRSDWKLPKPGKCWISDLHKSAKELPPRKTGQRFQMRKCSSESGQSGDHDRQLPEFRQSDRESAQRYRQLLPWLRCNETPEESVSQPVFSGDKECDQRDREDNSNCEKCPFDNVSNHSLLPPFTTNIQPNSRRTMRRPGLYTHQLITHQFV